MADAGTRQRLALMRMVQAQATTGADSRVQDAEKRRDRDLPELDHKIRAAVDKKDLELLQEMTVRVGCKSDTRQKVWPLLCGVLPADDALESAAALLQQRFKNHLAMAEVLGQEVSGADHEAHSAAPYAQRTTLLSPEQGKYAKSAGKCYYCGTSGHFLRECVKYFDAGKAKQTGIVTALLLDACLTAQFTAPVARLPTNTPVVERRQSLADGGALWEEDSELVRWLRALSFRLLEAVPEPYLAWAIVRNVVFGSPVPWPVRVAKQCEGVAATLTRQVQATQGAAAHAAQLMPAGASCLEEALAGLLRPMLGSLVALSSADSFVANDVVLRLWDAVLWHADPPVCASRFVLEMLQPLPSKVCGCVSWDGLVAVAHDCLNSFDTWADEKQRRTVERCCENERS
eukprot:Rhum_TRINITY_DN14632_c10_g2::Rhum_TRINITY_DN14632_c10_g2_i1::g.106427::m.106427